MNAGDILAEETSMALLSDRGGTAAWSGFSFLVGFVIVFRTSQAYSRFWDAMTDTDKMLTEWFDAASSICAFCRSSEREDHAVDTFLHTTVRLFSMLSASALQELSDVGKHQIWGLQTIDASSIDEASISALDASTGRVELLYHWIQQLVVANQHSQVLDAPPPIVNGALAELACGMSKFHDARKHAKQPFPFPYAQTTMMLLIFHWILTPLVMIQWTEWPTGAFVFTFVQVFTVWSLNAIATGFEKPFGGQENDIDPHDMQTRMNKQLLLLMEPRSRRIPTIKPSTILDSEKLRNLDSIHKAALVQEGWEIKELNWDDLRKLDVKRGCARCIGRLRPRRKAKTGQPKIAVSQRYCQKRYGMVDGERTEVLPVGIFDEQLVVAVPLCGGAHGSGKTYEVPNLSGDLCNLRMKEVPIRQRHGLLKVPDTNWVKGEYLTFEPSYNFRAEVLVTAYQAQKGKTSKTAESKVADENQEMMDEKMADETKKKPDSAIAQQLEHAEKKPEIELPAHEEHFPQGDTGIGSDPPSRAASMAKVASSAHLHGIPIRSTHMVPPGTPDRNQASRDSACLTFDSADAMPPKGALITGSTVFVPTSGSTSVHMEDDTASKGLVLPTLAPLDAHSPSAESSATPTGLHAAEIPITSDVPRPPSSHSEQVCEDFLRAEDGGQVVPWGVAPSAEESTPIERFGGQVLPWGSAVEEVEGAIGGEDGGGTVQVVGIDASAAEATRIVMESPDAVTKQTGISHSAPAGVDIDATEKPNSDLPGCMNHEVDDRIPVEPTSTDSGVPCDQMFSCGPLSTVLEQEGDGEEQVTCLGPGPVEPSSDLMRVESCVTLDQALV